MIARPRSSSRRNSFAVDPLIRYLLSWGTSDAHHTCAGTPPREPDPGAALQAARGHRAVAPSVIARSQAEWVCLPSRGVVRVAILGGPPMQQYPRRVMLRSPPFVPAVSALRQTLIAE